MLLIETFNQFMDIIDGFIGADDGLVDRIVILDGLCSAFTGISDIIDGRTEFLRCMADFSGDFLNVLCNLRYLVDDQIDVLPIIRHNPAKIFNGLIKLVQD